MVIQELGRQSLDQPAGVEIVAGGRIIEWYDLGPRKGRAGLCIRLALIEIPHPGTTDLNRWSRMPSSNLLGWYPA